MVLYPELLKVSMDECYRAAEGYHGGNHRGGGRMTAKCIFFPTNLTLTVNSKELVQQLSKP